MYKKLIPMLAAVLLLSGCSNNELFNKTKPDFDKSYTTSAEIRYGDLSATCDITRKSAGNWTFDFTEPDHLMGMQLSLSEDGVTAQLGELSVTADSSTVYQLIPDIIAQSVDTLAQVSTDSITADENDVLTINTEINGKNVI
ncbi:MAG: hypothetical protein E7478_10225, partial [Ruminococcaceae bacterium]|nr:hypothetical protein [Oscillospiraceae bacterium]